MDFVVFNLIPTPCKPDVIWAIIRIWRINMGLCWWLARYWIHQFIPCRPVILGATVWVYSWKVPQQISIILIRAMCCILPRVYPNFPWYYISDLLREFTVNGIVSISYFSHVESVLIFVSNFINFSVGKYSFTISMIW